MNKYDDKFYKNRHKGTIYSAEIILSIVQKIIPKINSAIDLGCGVGTWLRVLYDNGVKDICGVEGKWVNKDLLKISKKHFIEHDFAKEKLSINRKFDLAISLEVAEHLPKEISEEFVSLLINFSDFVLFSAAIPLQGGHNHINEQWLGFWIKLFKKKGFTAFDIIRKNIWNDEAIPFWYRQNILLFVNKERVSDLKISNDFNAHLPPEVYMLAFKKAIQLPGVTQSLKYLYLSLKKRLFKNNRTTSSNYWRKSSF